MSYSSKETYCHYTNQRGVPLDVVFLLQKIILEDFLTGLIDVCRLITINV